MSSSPGTGKSKCSGIGSQRSVSSPAGLPELPPGGEFTRNGPACLTKVREVDGTCVAVANRPLKNGIVPYLETKVRYANVANMANSKCSVRTFISALAPPHPPLCCQ